ncbi:SRPBCC domain-containing protein [Alkalihalobacillus sp. AL-G]|uniref:SRPBCC family protein n=1 Tax=Alkalihalobacillus sp. AL-G TaxID=2926399 RepID=UPI00272CBA07|nr:SRPBCC domain-containing protein [Alkalihalobacillus sp. AL-G]WLD91774.1 SRPBCC domain-containing protein [Alkalihalobacillus sp. AL-G]
MNSYSIQVQLKSDVQAVYGAITTPEGIKGWWTTDCRVSTEVGGKSSFYFEKLLFNSMEIIELAPFKKVRWKCVEGWSEWVGTEVVFTLSESEEGGTTLQFEHIGLTPDLKCYKMCSKGWDTTLKSLKAFVDTGKGKPHVPKTGVSGVLSRTAFKVFSRQYK